MELTLMFVGSEDILEKCRSPRREVLDLISSTIKERDYGSAIEYLRMAIIFQDSNMIELSAKISRKQKDASIDIELSREWIKNANSIEAKIAFLQCFIKAVEIVERRLGEKDDFNSQALILDLQKLIEGL